jgi:cold shock CspA family protein
VNKGAGGDDIFMHFSTTAGASTEKPSASDEGKSSGKSTVGKAISEVKLIGGSSSEIGSLKSNAERKGWTVIESNLNAGAGGDVIYLCYKTSRDGDYITGLYLSSAGNSGLANSITVGGKRYTLCPYEGGGHFTGIKGDLNSNAGGDDIHIYYTKDSFGDNRAVTKIWFNATSKGAVCKDNSSTPYDVNKGAGGDDIFMHFSTEK